MDILSLVLLIFSIISTILVLIAAIVGCLRGWKKSTFALCRTLIAALLSVTVLFIWHRITHSGGILTTVVCSFLKPDLLSTFEFPISEITTPILKALISDVTVPFDFALLFVIFSLLLLIPTHFIGKRMGIYTSKNEEKPKLKSWERIVGAAVRALCAVMTLSILYFPLANIIHSVSEPIKTAADITLEIELAAIDEDIQIGLVHEGLCLIEENIFYKTATSWPLCASLSLITDAQDTIFPPRNWITQTLNVFTDVLYFLEEPENFGQKQSDALIHITDHFIASEEYATLITTLLSEEVAADVRDKGETEAEKQFFGALALQLENMTPHQVQNDIETLRNIGVLCIDHGVISAGASLSEDDSLNLLSVLANEEFLYGLFSNAYNNEHTRTLLGHAFVLGFSALTPTAGENPSPTYANEIPSTLSDEDLRSEAKLFAQLLNSNFKEAATSASIHNSDLRAVIDLGAQSKLLSSNMKTLFSAYLDNLAPELDEAAQVIKDSVSGADIGDLEETCKACYIEAIEYGMEKESAGAYIEMLAVLLEFGVSDAHFEEWSKDIP